MAVLKLVALLLLPGYVATIAILASLDLPLVFEPRFLLPVLNTLFIGIVPIAVAYLAARVYIKTGASGFLLMGCGMLIFGLSAISAGWFVMMPGGPNITVTIHNSGAFLSGMFHAVGALWGLSGRISLSRRGKEKWSVVGAYGSIVVVVFLFSLASFAGLVPQFFVQRSGPTPLRQFVLAGAVSLYGFSSALFMIHYRKWRSDFLYWYALSLAMIAVGLFAIFVQKAVGSPIGWSGRSAQYIGGLFALLAVLGAVRGAISKGLPIEESIAMLFLDPESSYKNLIDMANDAIITFDKSWRIMVWNSSAERMFVRSRNEAIGSIFYDLVIPPRYSNVLKTQIESLRKRPVISATSKTIEIEGIRGDGVQFPVELSLSVRDIPGSWICTCIVRDVTQRKEAEQKIHDLNQTLEQKVFERTIQLQELNEALKYEISLHKTTLEDLRQASQQIKFHMENSPLGVIEWDQDYRVSAWSSAAERIFGWSTSEVIGKQIGQLGMVYEEDWNKVETAMAAMNNGSGNSTVNYNRNYCKDGSVIDCEWYNSSMLDESGNLVSVLSLVLDVTKRKKAEDEITRLNAELEERVARRTTELESVNRELESFSYSVSHDLRAPLRAINGFSQILLAEHKEYLNDEGKHYLENIVEAGDQMDRLITDLLEFSRLGRKAVRHQPVSLREVVVQVSNTLADLVVAKEGVVSIPDELPVVFGDPTLLNQVFTNLVINALTYHRENIPPEINISSETKNNKILIRVTDNGIGIEPEFHDKIFNIFQRLQSQDDFPGTGIGLAIVKKSVQLLDGQVWVESSSDRGTTFCISLAPAC